MTKLITAVIVVVVCWVAWIVYQQWTDVSSEQDKSQQQVEAEAREAAAGFDPRTLPGIPPNMKDAIENSLSKAQTSAAGLREWLKLHKKLIEDPRLGWIELDYAILVARDNPVEAKRVFHDVKERTSPTSPLYPRIKQLEKTYD